MNSFEINEVWINFINMFLVVRLRFSLKNLPQINPLRAFILMSRRFPK
jgi:hypothetical protein